MVFIFPARVGAGINVVSNCHFHRACSSLILFFPLSLPLSSSFPSMHLLPWQILQMQINHESVCDSDIAFPKKKAMATGRWQRNMWSGSGGEKLRLAMSSLSLSLTLTFLLRFFFFFYFLHRLQDLTYRLNRDTEKCASKLDVSYIHKQHLALFLVSVNLSNVKITCYRILV